MSSTDAGRHLLIVFCINLLVFFAQLAMMDINPTGNTFSTLENNALQKYNAGNYTLDQSNPEAYLPGNAGSISPTTGNIFTDIFTATKNFFLGATGFMAAFFFGVPDVIAAMGLYQPIEFGLSAMWLSYAIFSIAGYFFGR